MAGEIYMGDDGKTYIGPAGSTASTECGVIKDVDWDISREIKTVKYRGSPNGTSRAGKADISFNATLVRKPGDATYQTLLDHIRSGDPIAIKDVSADTGDGFDGDFIVSSGKFTTALEEFGEVSITCSLNTDLREITWIDPA